jgi:hypothetical protein
MLCLLVITNPTVKDFRQYLGRTSEDRLHRTSNFFILSTYKIGGDHYLGFFGNFIRTRKAPIDTTLTPITDVPVDDTAVDKPHIVGTTSDGLPILSKIN